MLTRRAMTALHIPHETAPQAAIHVCWPAAQDLWGDALAPAQAEFCAFLTKLSAGGAQPIVVYAASAGAENAARRALRGAAQIVRAPYGDVWARDTGPVFALEGRSLVAVRFSFNGWGGKYDLPGDQTIGAMMATVAGAQERRVDLVCEGGALEFDGDGTVLTTRQCLLNANRNPGRSERAVTDRLCEALGVERVIWLDEGLLGDHTDGHVDNIARFARPGVVICQSPNGSDDPNRRVLDDVARQLAAAHDAKGRRLTVVRIPSPGLVELDGAPAAASHLNWVIGAKSLVMPGYNGSARSAAEALQRIFQDRKVFESSACAILTGGGAFHCVTTNAPALREDP